MDKGNPKRANGEVTHGNEGTSHLSGCAKLVETGQKWREKREEEKRREKLLFLSSFLEDSTIGVSRSKRQSSSSRRELRVEIGIGEFRVTPRGRGFFLLGFYS